MNLIMHNKDEHEQDICQNECSGFEKCKNR